MNLCPCLLAGIWGTGSNFGVASESRNGVMSNFSSKKPARAAKLPDMCKGSRDSEQNSWGTQLGLKESPGCWIAGGEGRLPYRERINSEV